MIGLDIDVNQFWKFMDKAMTEFKLQAGDFRLFFGYADTVITDHVKDRFGYEGPGWRQLAASTRKARARRWGYYKKGGLTRGDAHPIGVWTGKMRRRALSKGKAKRKLYERSFGREDEIRTRLVHFHDGGRYQEARPIYRKPILEKLIKKHGDIWYRALAKAVNKMEKFKPLKGLGAILE